MTKQSPRAFGQILRISVFLLFCIVFSGCGSSSKSPEQNSSAPPGKSPVLPPLSAPEVGLSVTLTGVGRGTVQFGNNRCVKIEERISCQGKVLKGVPIEIQAIPAEGYLFHRWQGPSCSGSSPCVLTLNENSSLSAAFTMIAYASNQGVLNNSRDIFLTTTDRSRNDKITNNAASYLKIGGIKFSPDGEKIFYWKISADAAVPPHHIPSLHLLSLTPNGKTIGEEVKLAEFADGFLISEPQISPDGKRILYQVGNKSSANIEVLEFLDDQIPLFKTARWTSLSQCSNRLPRWSADGSKIFFFSNCALKNGSQADELDYLHLWSISSNLDQPAPERLTENYSNVGLDRFAYLLSFTDLEPSPKGDKLVFAKDDNDGRKVFEKGIWEITLSSRAITPLRISPGQDLLDRTPQVKFLKPRYSENGNEIFYLSDRETAYPYPQDTINSSGVLNLWADLGDTQTSPLTSYGNPNLWSIDDYKLVRNSKGRALIYLSRERDVSYLGMIQEDGLDNTFLIQFESDKIVANF